MVNIPGIGTGLSQIASQPINPDPTQQPGGFGVEGILRQVVDALEAGDQETAAQGIMQGRQADPDFDALLSNVVGQVQGAVSPEEAQQQAFGAPPAPQPFDPGFTEEDLRTPRQTPTPAEVIQQLPEGQGFELTPEQAAQFEQAMGRPAEVQQTMTDEQIRRMNEAALRPEAAGQIPVGTRQGAAQLKGILRGELNVMGQNIDAIVESVDSALGPEASKPGNLEITIDEQGNAVAQTTLPPEEGETPEDKSNFTLEGIGQFLRGESVEEQNASLDKLKADLLGAIDEEFATQSGIAPEVVLLAALQTLSTFFGGKGNINPILFNEIQRKGALQRRRAEARTEVIRGVETERQRVSQQRGRDTSQLSQTLLQAAQISGNPDMANLAVLLQVNPERALQFIDEAFGEQETE